MKIFKEWRQKNVKKKLINFLTPKGYKKGASGGAICRMLQSRDINTDEFREIMTKYGEVLFDATFYYVLEMAKDKTYLDNTTPAQALIDGHHVFQTFLSDFYDEIDENRERDRGKEKK